MIEGTVIRVEGISSAAKVFVGDETGEVLVLVWRNVLDRVQANTGLGTPGTKVRVVGEVNLYRSNLEVVPDLPSDVMVLSSP
jgi:DNA/RNA endonuclease YhcR with UshA esterase domain